MEMVGARVLSNPRPIVLFPFSLSPFQDEDERYIILFECSSRKRAILLPDPTSLSLSLFQNPGLVYIHTHKPAHLLPPHLTLLRNIPVFSPLCLSSHSPPPMDENS